MHSPLKYLKEYAHHIWIGLLFSFAIAIIVATFPVERKFMFEFQKNRPWMHESLFAPFDFPIHKTDEELVIERDSVSKGFKYYYSFKEDVVAQNLKELNKKVATIIPADGNDELTNDQKQLLIAIGTLKTKLNSVYEKGIISEEDSQKELDYTATVVLLRDKFATELTIQELFLIKQAVEQLQNLQTSLTDSLPQEYKEHFSSIDISQYIEPNVFFDEEKSELVKSSLLANISLTRGLVQKGEKIISSGDIVKEDEYRVLNSLKVEYETTNLQDSDWYTILIGQTILVLVSVFVLILFIYYAQPQILASNRESMFIIMIVLLFILLANLVIRFPQVNVYLVPFAMLPIIVKTFFNARIALFVHVITVLIVGFVVPNSFEFVFLQIIVGAMSLYTLGDTYKRRYLFLSSIIAMISYSVIYFGIGILQEADLALVNWQQFIWFAGSSILILTAQPLIYMFEKMFGFLSDATLMELSDTNHPLLRKLSDDAPGTFQHSLQVANLSEDAVKQIGGNALLARVGCLYHDIGKALNPAFFTENQKGRNPHDEKSPEESAKIIIDHIVEGEKLARKHNLPELIIGIITGHHGSSKVNYFLRTERNNNPDKEIDESKYQYPYDAPKTKEQAVVMMADAIEAASRSLKDINEVSLTELIDKIVNFQVSEGQFDYADISLYEISQVKQSFLKRLLNMHHVRIAYPEDNRKSVKN